MKNELPPIGFKWKVGCALFAIVLTGTSVWLAMIIKGSMATRYSNIATLPDRPLSIELKTGALLVAKARIAVFLPNIGDKYCITVPAESTWFAEHVNAKHYFIEPGERIRYDEFVFDKTESGNPCEIRGTDVERGYRLAMSGLFKTSESILQPDDRYIVIDSTATSTD